MKQMRLEPSVKDRTSESATINLVIDFVEQLTNIFSDSSVLHILSHSLIRSFVSLKINTDKTHCCHSMDRPSKMHRVKSHIEIKVQ